MRYYRPEIKGIDGEVDGYVTRRIAMKLSQEHAEIVARVQRQLEADKPPGTAPVYVADAIRHILESMRTQ